MNATELAIRIFTLCLKGLYQSTPLCKIKSLTSAYYINLPTVLLCTLYINQLAFWPLLSNYNIYNQIPRVHTVILERVSNSSMVCLSKMIM